MSTAVLLALAGGVVVASAAYGVLRWITPVDATKAAAEIDVTRVALTVVAGVGGVVALVIAYRRQRDLEQSQFVERFGAAAEQLGATDAAVRIAGVYAMAAVADESEGLRRQQCINVLCGYLRLPFAPEWGSNHQTKHVRKRLGGGSASEDEDHFEYRQNDSEVRKTIVRVIADHLRPEAEYDWSTRDFDFRTAYLEDADFSRAMFSGITHFTKTAFNGDAGFGEAKFNGDARFSGATFNGDARFSGATFNGDARFTGASFDRGAGFGGATFNGDARFGGATFSGDAGFGGAIFSCGAGFRGATFTGDVWFTGATFTGEAGFEGVVFSGLQTSFLATDFGTRRVVFTAPRQWGPPPPEFDWGDDGEGKPSNVQPASWPPTVVAPP
ncbi:pentapeptide repeat-containing protein [Nocardia asiatica]|uniref:pentapeptide repeat-containing protein n=1 Tax=Nocardia asiatica TaxID=209252 RepID=UPI003EE0133C